MSIERIKEQAAKADQMIMDLGRGGAPVEEQPTAAQEPDIEEAAQPEVEMQQPDQGVVADAATEDQPDAELARVREDAAKWEQRYRSLDGMIQARDRQIEQLHQLLAAMQQATAPKAEAEDKPQAKQKLVTEKDEEAFGADLVDLARRVAKEESGAYIAQLEAQVAQLQERLQGVAQTTAVADQDRFENRLTQAVPNWREIDSDPKFIEWLNASPVRMKMFRAAAEERSVSDVAYFFSEYAEKHPKAAAPKADPRLEKQVAPGKSRAVASPQVAPTDKKQWTRTEIADFYANGKKRYSPEEYTRMERDLFAAQREGRVDFTR